MTDIVDVIGNFGLYHALIISLAVLRSFPTGWTNLMTPVLAPDVDHWCAPPSGLENFTAESWKNFAIPLDSDGNFEKCIRYEVVMDDGSVAVNKNVTVACDRWQYNVTNNQRNLVNEFDLVCSNDWQRSAMQSIVMVGSFVGVLIYGEMSDRFGRKPTFFVAATIILVVGCLSSLAPSMTWFNIARFIVSSSVSGIQATTVSLTMEILPTKYRSFLLIGVGIGYTSSLLCIPLLAWLIKNWVYLQLAVGLSAVPLLPFWFFIQESPRWLMTRERYEQTQRTLIKILRINRRPILDMPSVMSDLILKTKAETANMTFRFGNFFKTPRLRRTTLCMFFLWFSGSLLRYRIALSATRVPGNPLLNYFLSTVAEFPADLVSLYLIMRFRRRITFALFLFLAGLSVLIDPIIPNGSPTWVWILAHMMLRFFTGTSNNIRWVYVLEVFPTSARSFGFACCMTCSRIGAIMAPFLKELGMVTHSLVPTLLMASLFFVSLGVTFLLPETHNKPLPDTFYEADKMNKHKLTVMGPQST